MTSLQRFLLTAGLLGAASQPLTAQVVRGQVVDSITRGPLAGASVSLLDSAGLAVATTRTDSTGLFLVRPPAPAGYRLQAALDGYTTSTFPPFDFTDGEPLSYVLLLPSTEGVTFEMKMTEVCGPATGERFRLGGWIRYGATGAPATDASLRTSWATQGPGRGADRSLGEYAGTSSPDEDGFYAICGAPFLTAVWLHASSDSGVSNFHSATFLGGTVAVDGQEHLVEGTTWRLDLGLTGAGERSTALTGTVTEAANGRPVAGAAVEITGTSYVTGTDSLGTFEFTALPAGPVRLTVRRIGFEQLQQALLLPRVGTVEIPPGMLALGTGSYSLDPLVVETTAPHDPLAEFRIRQTHGTGDFVTREEFMSRGSPARATDVLRTMSGVRVTRGRDFDQRWIVQMQRGGPRTFGFARGQNDTSDEIGCPPLYFLDRHPIGNASSVDIDGAIPLEDIEAVEAHGSAASMPTEFNRPGANCGVIAFWTRFADPRTIPVEPEPEEHRSFFKSTGFHFLVALGAVAAFFFGLGEAIHF